MHLTYGYDLKEGDDILIPPRRTGDIMGKFILPGTALVNHLPFRAVPSLLLPCDYLTAIFSQTHPFLGSFVQV